MPEQLGGSKALSNAAATHVLEADLLALSTSVRLQTLPDDGVPYRYSLAPSAAAAPRADQSRNPQEVAQEKAQKLRRTIEDELSSEYERTTTTDTASSVVPPPPPPSAAAPVSALERVKEVGTQLFSPLEDAGGAPSGPSEPESVMSTNVLNRATARSRVSKSGTSKGSFVHWKYWETNQSW